MRPMSSIDTGYSMADIGLKVCDSIPSSTSTEKEKYQSRVDNILNFKSRKPLDNNSNTHTKTQNTRQQTKTNIFSIFG